MKPVICFRTRPQPLTQRLVGAVFLISLFAIGLQTAAAVASDLRVFDETYDLTMKHYVDAPDPAALAAGAVSGMEEYVASMGKGEPHESGSVADFAGNSDAAKGKVHEVFDGLIMRSSVASLELERAALKGMLKNLDPHSAYMTPELYKEIQVETKGEFGGIGIQIGMKVDRLTVIAPIEDTPAYRAGIRAGDFILKINEEPTKGLNLMEAVQRLRGLKGTPVILVIERPGIEGSSTFTLVRDVIKIQSVKSKILDNNIGYVRVTQFQESTARDFGQTLNQFQRQQVRAIVVDLRNNPGGLLTAAVGVAEQFVLPNKLVVYIKGRDGRRDDYVSKRQGTPEDTPMIVLVNEGTASGAEIVTGALKDWGKAVVVGSKTFGKGSVQTILALSDGSGLRLTTAKYYTPLGRSIQSAGILPDVTVTEADKTNNESSDFPLLVAQKALSDSRASRQVSKDKLIELAQQAATGLVPPLKSSIVASKTEAQPGSTGSSREPRPVLGHTGSDVDHLPAVASRPTKNGYAIVIGIEQYREKLPPADFSDRDARLMGEYLTKVLGYPEENVVVRINEKAARTDLEKYLEAWLPNHVEKDSSVFIYYSGHGAPNPKTGEAYLVPFDGDPAFVETTSYPIKRLYAALDKLPAHDITVVLDSCFSGAGGRSVIAKGMRPMGLVLETPFAAVGKMVVLTASSGDQVSSTYEEKGHGLLTYFFLRGLQGDGDANKDGVIEMGELFNYVKPNVQKVARRQYNNEQTPQLLASPEILRKGGGRLVERTP